jgi:DNA-binding LacI/PurR family transcriptional regulator
MARMPTVDDVALAAQVSRQTVSNVINTPAIVREQTRVRVQEAIDRLGYRSNASARRLRTRKSSTIGLRLDPLRDGISGAVLDRFVHKLAEHADTRGLRVMIFTADGPEDELAHIRRLHDGSDIDAYIVIATFHGDPRIAWLLDHDVPFVSFGRPWGSALENPRHRWVDVDGRAGVRDATTRLRAAGCRTVAYIGWPSPSGTGDERRGGWQEACELSTDDQFRYHVITDDGVDQGAASARHLLNLVTPPDAIVCASDSLALGASMAATEAGFGDLPIIGFDNTPVAAAVGLSSIDQPLDEVVSVALAMLFGPEGDVVVPNPNGDPDSGPDRGPDGEAKSGPKISPNSNEEPTNRLLVPRLVERRSTRRAFDETTGA